MSLRSLKKNIERILRELKLSGSTVEVTLCDAAFMRRANRKYMYKAGTTDVLSFPQLTPQKNIKSYCGKFLGDILISLDAAALQAKEQRLTLVREVLFLTLHSILHLVGHDHAKADERLRMQAIESRIWKRIIG